MCTEIFVSGVAAPGGDGSRERPFATIEEGRDALRRVAKGERVLTLLRGGRIRTSIELGPEDAGLEIGVGEGLYDRPGKFIPVVRLVGGVIQEKPVLRPVTDDAVLARLPTDGARAAIRVIELPAGETWAGPVHRGMGAPVVPVGTEVFADGQPLVRARWPNEGFVRVGEIVDAGSVPRQRAADVAADQRETGPERGGVFRFAEPPAAERLARWAGASGAWAFGYWHHDWADELLPVERIDPASGTVKLGQPHRYGLRKGGTCYLVNLLEELDSPGEFFLDPEADRLYLWPPTPKIRELLLPTLAEPVFRIRGSAESHDPGPDHRGHPRAGDRRQGRRGSAPARSQDPPHRHAGHRDRREELHRGALRSGGDWRRWRLPEGRRSPHADPR